MSNLQQRASDDIDWPSVIFLYVILIILGVGMCFCLRQANRLIPNRFTFPLVDRGTRLQDDISVEEEGLLHHYSSDNDQDAEIIDNQADAFISNTPRNNNNKHHSDSDEEDLQYANYRDH